MKTAPAIIVQLIHIEGPMKGQILELSDHEINIGRHPSCQLKFPPDFNIVSRKHATISREGNRFKLTDHSSNGTIVNGRRIKEIYLTDGDVLTISEGGPKISFLTRMGEPSPIPQTQETPPPSPPPEEKIIAPPVQEEVQRPAPQPPPMTPKPDVPPAAPVQKTKEPLIIQYGPTLRSFDMPLKIGKHPDSDFSLDQVEILDFHAEIYFSDGQYWVRDLTGQQTITINNIPVGEGAALRQNDELALSSRGPFFQFLGNGRLSEVEKTAAEAGTDGRNFEEQISEKPPMDEPFKKPMSFLKKIFKKN
ncbi:MAG: FHA domain-containing protein [Thermodesulfobacteriota bacterium]|nr:FHA domain-containing protein [Thermodesulfobacteriota bacterium]